MKYLCRLDQFGYHVVKVNDKRPSRGTITAAHIMVNLNSDDAQRDPEERINEIYKKLVQGENFEALARQFSEDKSSAGNGGHITPFKSGQLSSTKFEDEAFALQNDDDYSKPFKTAYGWHIVKRINHKPIEPFEDLKAAFENKVKRDSRSKLINEAMVSKLKKKYKIDYNERAKDYFTSILTEDFYSRSWELPSDFKSEATIFTINKRPFTYKAFGDHLVTAQRIYSNKNIPFSVIVEKEFESFFEKSIFKFREDNLETENQDYANILKEYRDGLLLFDLMEKEVWNKAAKDTLGLEAYYNKNKSKYQWSERVDVVIASSADESTMKKVAKMLKKGKSEDDIKSAVNTTDKQNVIFTKGTYRTDNPILPSDFVVKKGVSKVYEHNEAFHVLDVKAVLPAGQKSLEEAKGSVINNYQTELEAQWIQSLYDRFDVEVNKGVLNAIKAKLGN